MADELLSADPHAGQASGDLLSTDPAAHGGVLVNSQPIQAGDSIDKLKDAYANPTFRQEVVEPNTLGTLASHAWAQINPVAAVEGLAQSLPIPQSLGGAGLDAPIQLAKRIGAAQGALYDKAKNAFDQGDYLTAARHFVNYLLPVIGPSLDKSSDLFQEHKWAAGGGDALGIGLALFGPAAISEAATRVAGSGPATTAADALDEAANKRVVDVISPKVGPNKMRFGNMATDVAPDIARDTTGLTRGAIADSVADKLDAARAGLDAAADARLNARTFSTDPILQRLQVARDRLTAQAVQGSQFTPQSGVNRPPIGQDVVPGPNAARVGQIDQAMDEIRQLGPVSRYEPLRRIREAYDQVAQTKYSPAVTTDFLAKQGAASGAADVTGALRDHLASLDPVTAQANVDYSLWKKADQVLQAAEEVDRVRPTVGRAIMARGLGAAVGAAAGGAAAGPETGALTAAAGAMLGPMLERGMANVGPMVKMGTARLLADVADTLRTGQPAAIQAAMSRLQRIVPALVAAQSGSAPAAPMAAPAMAGQTP